MVLAVSINNAVSRPLAAAPAQNGYAMSPALLVVLVFPCCLPAGSAHRGGDGRRTQAALSAGAETHGSWHMQCMVERYKAVLPNAVLPHARVSGNGLFAHGVALGRAGHVKPYRGKRLRCTPAGGWAE